MNRPATQSIALVSALILSLSGARISSAADGNTRVTHTVLATSGSPAPDGGNFSQLGFSGISLNARSQVAFDALLTGPSNTGVFKVDGRRTSTIALGGNPDPAAQNFVFVSAPFITDCGDVVFLGQNADSDGIFRRSRGGIIPLVLSGDPLAGGGTLFPGEHSTNARGEIAFNAFVDGSPITQAVLRTDGANPVVVARDDIAAPTGGTFVFFAKPAINVRGQVTFFAETTGGSADFAIFRGDGGTLTPVFAANQLAPGGATFQDFSDPLINDHGQVAATALLTDSAGNSVGNGLFVGDGRKSVAIALEGQAAPSGGNYGGRLGFFAPLTLNERGEVAFHVGLLGGTSSSGIFRGDGRRTSTVALAETPAPGTTGTFESFRDMKLLDDGRVAFVATLTQGVGGVDPTNNLGIWVGSSQADLQLVVRTGQVVGGQVLTGLQSVSGGTIEFNSEGVLWVGRFPGSPRPATAVVFSRVRDGSNRHQGE